MTTRPTVFLVDDDVAVLKGLGSLLGAAGYDVQAHDPDYFAKDLARYRAVTAAQVQAAAKKYLAPNARVVLTISPGKKVVSK